jgi:hypothetical protein
MCTAAARAAEPVPISAPLTCQGAATAPTGAPVRLQRTPAVGERLTHAFVLDQTLVVQRMATRVGADEQLSQDQIEFGGRTTLRFVDEVRAVADGRATLLRRALEDAHVHVDMRLQPAVGRARTLVLDGGSPLTGASVLHTYVPARGEYGRMYDATETSEEFLPRLFTDIDLTCLLPAAPVRVGDAWEIAPTRLIEVFAYGGLVPVRFEDDADPQLVRTTALGVAGPLYEIFGGETAGVVGAKLAAVESGIARIALAIDVSAKKDQTALSSEKLTPGERYDALRVADCSTTWKFRGEGELRWDVAAGRPVALALAGAEELRLVLALDGPGGGGGSDMALAGGLKLAIDVAGN